MTLLTRLALAALLAGGLVGCQPADAPRFNAVDITGAEYGRQFQLADQNGVRRNLTDFSGKVVVVFFGYTQCPDVCPTTLSQLVEVKRQLGPDAARVQPVFVSVDPQRDTAVLLREYLAAFGPDFLGLRPGPTELDALIKDFKLFVGKSGDVNSDHYTIDHTAGLYVYDPQGRLRLFVRHGEPPARLAADLRLLLAGH